ncbi:hypothetical protein M2105_006404 [Paenibacillus sp. PastF-1]|nr:hypothetical protein [Paenibacillus sp. PastF-2]MDF9851922.1 hypothetical protein [Paenibacillus sp. PastM-2]MDF9858486.1 hypothetical protein [Paenibacillus sp. PastF-1]MDH6483769.1 hypothetical protein [Paenibacillus sp. PastH-2]MDH6511151.1 hypothetical protein [Paenibacillus sp. PastM-3]
MPGSLFLVSAWAQAGMEAIREGTVGGRSEVKGKGASDSAADGRNEQIKGKSAFDSADGRLDRLHLVGHKK